MDVKKIIKQGNSCYVSISIAYMKRLELKKGDYVTVELTPQGLLIKPLKINNQEDRPRVLSVIEEGIKNVTDKTKELLEKHGQ